MEKMRDYVEPEIFDEQIESFKNSEVDENSENG